MLRANHSRATLVKRRRMQCSLTADDMRNTLTLSVTKVIVYSANHKPGISVY